MGCSTSKPPEIDTGIPEGSDAQLSAKVDTKLPSSSDVKVVNENVVKEGVEALKEAEKVQQKDADAEKVR